MLSHIRKATLDPVATRNCQPFVRELGGVWHAFAHNGDLKGIAGERGLAAGRFRPVGETDSELAFCTRFAHAHRRHQNDGTIRPRGMWRLGRRCPAGGELTADGLRIAGGEGEQEVQLVASAPLGAERWVALGEGELVVARQGRLE